MQKSDTHPKKRGFTLLELIIVIAILAVLAVAIILVINPAQTLAKARDSQRLSDLAALKSAVALYLTDVSAPNLIGVGTINDAWISTPTATTALAATATACGVTAAALGPFVRQAATLTAAAATNGTGWFPVNLQAIASGSPLSNLPLDPTNSVAATTGVTMTTPATDHTYCYRANASNDWEIDANMESNFYSNGVTGGSQGDKEGTDGGDNAAVYEIGFNLLIYN